ncbi:MAG: hypothetical protein Unbinned4311contig1001_9 [Prokaryotic dsDNA virus sp.]|nr:MAG: hypothetical protein Unbinned4311contig1001_9 [Prokaryotic dsDNA virus sp.]|tara:strand:+ start:1773 stop:2174 length:402 start_codon:yes stop_codon:yes gene_type:complete
MTKKKDTKARPLSDGKPNVVMIKDKEYVIPDTISIELYEKVIPMIDMLDANKLRSPDLKLGEIAKMLAAKGQLNNFVHVVLGLEKVETDLDFSIALKVICDFFMLNASSMILSGIFFMAEEIQQGIVKEAKAS